MVKQHFKLLWFFKTDMLGMLSAQRDSWPENSAMYDLFQTCMTFFFCGIRKIRF